MKIREESQPVRTEAELRRLSPTVDAFLETRERLNGIVLRSENPFTKRFFNLDHNAYGDGQIPKKYKELMGLASSAVLRCDDCILYHIIESAKHGASRGEIEESLNIALIVGGSIVIPHLRRAHAVLAELFEEEKEESAR